MLLIFLRAPISPCRTNRTRCRRNRRKPGRAKRLMALMTRHQRADLFLHLHPRPQPQVTPRTYCRRPAWSSARNSTSSGKGTDFVAWGVPDCILGASDIPGRNMRGPKSCSIRRSWTSSRRTANTLAEDLDERHEALERCLQKLHPRGSRSADCSLRARRRG